MKDTAKTLAILKTRWREVVLIIAIQVLSSRLLKMRSSMPTLDSITALAVFVVSVVILLTYFTLLLGFERTVYLEGDKPQSPILLLRLGKRFLIRYVVWSLLMGIIYIILLWLVYLITNPFFHLDTGPFKVAEMYPFAYIFNSLVAVIVLAKLMLLTPAIIIVYDCKLFKSLSFLHQHRLRSAKELVFLCVVLIVGVNLLWASGLTPNSATTVFQYVLSIAYLSTKSFLWLMVATMAVIFVGRGSSGIEKTEEAGELKWKGEEKE
ncbi:MAG: hypothetical protein MUO22_05090 [Sedimentisphaerales bacterium]|nr:hypothetical protein [Sedimentisphaerales bacterium]